MRKLIILVILVIGIACVIIIASPDFSIVPAEHLHNVQELPRNLLRDIDYVLHSVRPPLTLYFSHDDFFFDETIHVSISASNPDAAIYFTTDGSVPNQNSERFLYPLELIAGETVELTVIKAIAIDDTGQSIVRTQSFFVGKTVHERFSTYVFSIATDEVGLYDHVRGILVPGLIWEDYITEDPDPPSHIFHRPGNHRMRGRAWERPIHVEAFTQNGKRVISQNAGMRVHGGTSRWMPQRGLRLVARREYEPGVGRFHHQFFEDYMSSGPFARPIVSHDTLVLRNSSSTWLTCRLRTQLASWIAREAGYATVSPVSAAAVFINGEYYGFLDINLQLNEQFLEDQFNAPQRAFDIVDGGFNMIRAGEPGIINDFNRLLEYAEDGFDDYEIQFVHSIFDVESLLFYYAIQIYISNVDWPNHPTNTRVWRYTGPTDIRDLAPELDGRWRFVLWDLDITMYANDASSPDAKSISRLFGGGDPVFEALLERPEYIEIFANFITDLTFEHFSMQNVQRVVSEYNDMNLEEQKLSLLRWEEERNTFYDFINADEDRRQITFFEHRERVMTFIERRPTYILSEMRELFGFSEMYRISTDGSAKINTLNGTAGYYFIENRVPVTPILQRGQAFDHWLVNGEIRYEEDLIISFDDATSDGTVFIELVTREEWPPLIFDSTFDTGDLFGFTMYNPNNYEKSTRGLYLSDNISDLKRWQFPDTVIHSGITWEFVGRNVTSTDALLSIGLNFNPRHGEVIFLSDENGNILDYIAMRP